MKLITHSWNGNCVMKQPKENREPIKRVIYILSCGCTATPIEVEGRAFEGDNRWIIDSINCE